MIKVCESNYGGRTCIYSYINPTYIVQLKGVSTQYENNVEAELINGKRVIILYDEDLLMLVGPEYFRELKEVEDDA